MRASNVLCGIYLMPIYNVICACGGVRMEKSEFIRFYLMVPVLGGRGGGEKVRVSVSHDQVRKCVTRAYRDRINTAGCIGGTSCVFVRVCMLCGGPFEMEYNRIGFRATT